MKNRQFRSPKPKSSGFSMNGRPVRTNSRPTRQGAYINPERFVNKAVAAAEQPRYVQQHHFKDFALDERLKVNITAKGYDTPTPIQDQSIKPVLAGQDLVGLANTGTGKTAAFLLPIITQILAAQGRKRAIVIVPTRELAVQIDEEFRSFVKGLNLYSALCVGGESIYHQRQALGKHPQIVIGTPGRLKDLVGQQILKLQHTNILVLDEADRMFDMGFIRDIRFLVAQLPKERQSLCFSATMPREIEQFVHEVLTNPVRISVKTSETSSQIEQSVIKTTSKEHKFETLIELLARPGFEKILVFGATKWGVQRLADNLNKKGIKTEAIHGNKSQPQRQRALKSFKAGQVRVLVATDVAARGLDIPDVSHVINFDQPNTYDDYVHRIGRTGRANKQGSALTFVS